MLKKLIAISFVCLFVVVLGFAQAGYAIEEFKCYQGVGYIKGEWANYAEPWDPTYEYFYDKATCAFVKLDNEKKIHQIILRGEGEDPYFAITDYCVDGARGKQICAIEEWERDTQNPDRRIVHGGTAVITRLWLRYGKVYLLSGKFIAGPAPSNDLDNPREDELEEDEYLDRLDMLFYTAAKFNIYHANRVECPPDNYRGCEPVNATE